MPRFRTVQSGSKDRSFCVAALLLCTSFIACTGHAVVPAAPASESITLTIGVPMAAGVDPLRGIQQATRLISHEGLFGTNRDGRPQSRLAETWQESADGLTWHFTLRRNAFFHDGSAVDSHAVKASLERSLATADTQQYPGLADILAIEAPSRSEIAIRLRRRSAFLLDDLGVSILKLRPGTTPVGTGPYIGVTSSGNESIMTAFPKYYRGAPVITRVVWKAYPAVRAAWAAMMRGEVDFLYEVGDDAREFIEAETSTRIYPFLRNYVYMVALNHRRNMFQDRRIRRAMNFAIDRSSIIENAFQRHGRPASIPAWPEHWAYDQTVPAYSYDPSRALALLDAAMPRDVKPDPTLQPATMRFICLIPENFALWERIGLLVQRNLAAIGVDMQLEAVPAEQFNKRIATGDFEAALLEIIVGNTASRPFTFWYSKSGQNPWGYRSVKTDFALDQLRYAPDEATYREAFRNFQLESLEDAPAIFIALGETARAVSKRFEVIAPPGSDIVRTIADWRLSQANMKESN
jgi:peptide/nickel transport system substrate-binding protein